jgi:hypothetical protein
VNNLLLNALGATSSGKTFTENKSIRGKILIDFWNRHTPVVTPCLARAERMRARQSSPEPAGPKAKKAHPHLAKRPKRWYVLQTSPDQCAEMKFDNTDGRFVDGLKPCDDQIKFDQHGRPIPMGTIHRLDAISRSFFGR